MKIAFLVESGYPVVFGGHQIQLEKTKKYIEILGHEVIVVSDRNQLENNFDIIHLWTHGSNICKFLDDYSIPKVVSTIYHSKKIRERFVFDYYGFLTYAKAYFRDQLIKAKSFWLNKQSFKFEKDLYQVIEKCDLFLPNSHSEARSVIDDLGVSTPYFVIPNAVDKSFKDANPDKFYEEYKVKNFIVCVGRIEPYKNQLQLLRALEGTDYHLVLIGPSHPDHLNYFAECQKYFGKNVLYIPNIPHNELGSAYAAAKVSVLPSYFETTGLVNLEAGLAGVNVVTTNRGYTKEYFEDFVWYCDPSKKKSIKNAIDNAWLSPKKKHFEEKILTNYIWEVTAAKTIEAYNLAINRAKHFNS